MPTMSQLVRAGRKQIVSKTKSPALQDSPQKRGVCVRVFTSTPKSAAIGGITGSTARVKIVEMKTIPAPNAMGKAA